MNTSRKRKKSYVLQSATIDFLLEQAFRNIGFMRDDEVKKFQDISSEVGACLDRKLKINLCGHVVNALRETRDLERRKLLGTVAENLANARVAPLVNIIGDAFNAAS